MNRKKSSIIQTNKEKHVPFVAPAHKVPQAQTVAIELREKGEKEEEAEGAEQYYENTSFLKRCNWEFREREESRGNRIERIRGDFGNTSSHSY